MADQIRTDICVIGAGSGGLTVAAVAAQLGVPTVLIEQGEMGGDCLNYGCVPSKALLAAAHAADAVRGAKRFGIHAAEPAIDAAGVFGHVRRTIEAIAPNDSQARFEGFGATVLRAPARFTGPRTLQAEETTVTARRFVVATGSVPLIPPIEGLDNVPYLTNETVFSLGRIPDHLAVIGGGPVGIEMAQAFRGLGARVTVLEMARILPKDDPDLTDVLRRKLSGADIDIREGAQVTRVAPAEDGVVLTLGGPGGGGFVHATDILVAAGRRANVDGLGLEAAGVAHDAKGVEVDARLRTTNRKIFAVGDVAGDLQFTHIAGYHAGIVIRNALFRWPAKVNRAAYPWVTYTDPEIAQVGMTEAMARDAGIDPRVLTWPFADNDRAHAEGETAGLIKVVTTDKGKILGAGIAGRQAGELIHMWGLAIQAKLKIGKIADMIAPYPTLGEIGKRAAGTYYMPALFGPRARKIVNFLSKLG